MSKIKPQAGMTAIHTPSSGGPQDTVTITGNDHGRVYFKDRNGVKGGDYEACFEVVGVPKKEEPKAGQWWLTDDGRPMLIAFDERTIGSESSCPIIAYRKPNCGEWYAVNRFVRRLPDDAGFDYKPEPEVVFPQYCIPSAGGIKTCHNKQVAFWKFDDNENGRTFHTDGTSFPFGSGNFKDDKKRAVPQEEALARITSIDVFSLMFDPKTFTSDWGPFQEQPPKPNRIPVRLWGRIDKGGAHMYVFASKSPPVGADTKYAEIKFDPQLNITASGFYVEGTGK